MTLIVETGAGLSGAESYVSVADCSTYAVARGLTFPTSPAGLSEEALRRATNAVDSKYRSRLPGFRTQRRAQALEWPRTSAFVYQPDNSRGASYANNVGNFGYGDLGYTYLPANEVPIEIIRATCEAAVRELIEPGSMMPDLDRGGQIRGLKAGSVAIDYAPNADVLTTFTIIDGILGALLGPMNVYSAKAVRG